MGGQIRKSESRTSDGTRERGRLYCIVAGLLVVAALHVGPRLAARRGTTARADVLTATESLETADAADLADPATAPTATIDQDLDRADARQVPAYFTGAVPLRAERSRPPGRSR